MTEEYAKESLTSSQEKLQTTNNNMNKNNSSNNNNSANHVPRWTIALLIILYLVCLLPVLLLYRISMFFLSQSIHDFRSVISYLRQLASTQDFTLNENTVRYRLLSLIGLKELARLVAGYQETLLMENVIFNDPSSSASILFVVIFGVIFVLPLVAAWALWTLKKTDRKSDSNVQPNKATLDRRNYSQDCESWFHVSFLDLTMTMIVLGTYFLVLTIFFIEILLPVILHVYLFFILMVDVNNLPVTHGDFIIAMMIIIPNIALHGLIIIPTYYIISLPFKNKRMEGKHKNDYKSSESPNYEGNQITSSSEVFISDGEIVFTFILKVAYFILLFLSLQAILQLIIKVLW